MAGGAVGNPVGRGDDLLVVAVEEVDLEALDAHVGIVLHHGLGDGAVAERVAADEVAPAGPEDDAHALLLAVGDQALQVDGGIELLHERLTAAPALVDDDILQVVVGGEVDIIQIGIGVHAALEVDTRDVGVVPPVPGHFARLDPRGVLDAALGGQPLRHVAVEDVGIALRDDHGAPGQAALAAQLSDEIGPFGRHEVQSAIAADLLLQGIRRKLGHQPLALRAVGFRPLQEHAGVVLHAGIHHDGLKLCCLRPVGQADGQGRDGQRVAEHLRQPLLVVIRLKRVAIPLAATVVVDVGHKGLIVVGKAEFGGFIDHGRGFCILADEAVGGPVVVGPHLDGHLLVGAEQQLSIRVADGGLLIERCLETGADAVAGHLARLAEAQQLVALL